MLATGVVAAKSVAADGLLVSSYACAPAAPLSHAMPCPKTQVTPCQYGSGLQCSTIRPPASSLWARLAYRAFRCSRLSHQTGRSSKRTLCRLRVASLSPPLLLSRLRLRSCLCWMRSCVPCVLFAIKHLLHSCCTPVGVLPRARGPDMVLTIETGLQKNLSGAALDAWLAGRPA